MAIINIAADFLRALSDHPEWKASVRAQILGEELLQLPVQFQAFVQRQQQFNDRMQEFVEQQQGFNDRFEARMDRIEGDISVVKGDHARSRGVDAAPAIADDLNLEIRPESQLAGFSTAPERRNTVVNDMFMHVTHFNYPCLQR